MDAPHSKTIAYRPEVDGLRAIAVLPVILFHAGITFFSGGFVGVDVFFVISGYLITSILARELEEGKFSIKKFYERRARRILPALFFVIVCCLPTAYLWLLPGELQRFGQSLISVATFSSNIYFWRKTGYFEPNADESPLLHTWSLAVEEQYYVLFPLVLALFWRFGKRRTFWLVATATACSLLLCEWGSNFNPTANFYLLPTRAWELFAGSLIALWPISQRMTRLNAVTGQYSSLIGLGMILYAVFLFDQGTPFPSYYTLIPILGTVLVLACSRPDHISVKLLSSTPFVSIGVISYSAYLWHQPLYAFARVAYISEPPTFLLLGLGIFSLLLAWLTWKFIEAPFRNPSLVDRKKIFTLSASALLVTASVGLAFNISHGAERRFSKDFQAKDWEDLLAPNKGLSTDCEYKATFFEKPQCKNGPTPNALLWGDSVAMHLAAGLQVSGVSFVQATKSVCGPSFTIAPYPNSRWYDKTWSNDCYTFNQSVLSYLKYHPAIKWVFMSSRLEVYTHGQFFNGESFFEPTDDQRSSAFTTTIHILRDMGITPVFISPLPETGENIAKCLIRNSARVPYFSETLNTHDCSFELSVSNQYNEKVIHLLQSIKHATDVKMVNLDDFLCTKGKCTAWIDGVPIYRDSGHLSKRASGALAIKYSMWTFALDAK